MSTTGYLPYLSDQVRRWSPEELAEHVQKWLHPMTAEDSSTIASYGMSGADFIDHPLPPITAHIGVMGHMWEIRQLRKWGDNTSTPLPPSDFVAAALRRYNILQQKVWACACHLFHRAKEYEELAHQLDSDWYRMTAASHHAYATVILRDVGGEWREKLLSCAMGTSTSYFTVEHEGVHGRSLPKLVIAGASYRALSPGKLCQDTLGTPLSDLVAPGVRESIGAMEPACVSAWISHEMETPGADVMIYTFDRLLPPISGPELLALTPDQLGIRLAIDGVSPLVQAKMIVSLLERR